MPYLGAHMSIAGGVSKALERALSIGCEAAQIFVKQNNQWKSAPISDEEAAAFKKIYSEKFVRGTVFAHAAYLINLASPDDALRNKSIDAMTDEIERCDKIGVDGIVLHIGSHMGAGEREGLKRVAAAFDVIFERTAGADVKILMETTAGQGTNLGHKIEHLQEARELTKRGDRLGLCIDTCHVYSAGYDINDEADYERLMGEISSRLGFESLKAVHLNDSMKPFGSRLDRHEHIGKGTIGLEGFRRLLNDERLANLPMALETPKEKEMLEDIENLKILRGLIAPKKGVKK